MSPSPESSVVAEAIAPRVSARLAPAVWKTLDRLDALGRSYHEGVTLALESHRAMRSEVIEVADPRPLAPEDDRYAALTADKVLGPIVGTLRRLDTGGSLEELWGSVQADLAEAVRYASSIRFAGSHEALERVVRYHATVRLPETLRPLFLGRATLLGLWGHELERGARGWWRALLDSSEESESPEADGVAKTFDPVGSAQRVIETALEAVANSSWTSVRDEVTDVLAAAEAALSEDLDAAVAGRFKRQVRKADQLPWHWVVGPQTRWGEWHRQAASRIALEVTLVRVRDGLFGLAASEIDQVRGSAQEIARMGVENSDALRVLADELKQVCDSRGMPTVSDLEALMSRCLRPIDEELVPAVEAFATSDEGPGLSGDRVADAAYRFVATQPETFAVHPVGDGDRPDPSSSSITFEFRRAVAQCVDALLIERLRETPGGVIDSAQRARAVARKIPEIIRSAFTALLEALDPDGSTSLEGDDLAAIVPEALRRAADVAAQLQDLVLEDLLAWEEETRLIIDVGWVRLTERAALTSGVGEQWAGLRSGASIAFRESLGAAVAAFGARIGNGVEVIRRGWTAARRLNVWLERADPDPAIAQRSPTSDFLARSDQLGHHLPLVYRRLFAAEGVRESSLIVARRDLMEEIKARFRGDSARALMIVADPGSGLSSLFRALMSDPDLAGQILHLPLNERILNDSSLLTVFANQGIEDHGFGLRGLGARIADHAPEGQRSLALIEDLEHTFLRRSEGARLVQAFVAAMLESSEHVTWVAGISSAAWQVILQTYPHLAAGLDVVKLGPLSRADLEIALWRRHQRSGIPLDFTVPEGANPMLARRIRRALSAERRTRVLREEYFDRLHRACGGFVGLALALWVDGLELDENTGRASLRFPLATNESFLDTLQLEEIFALKAFLEHGSLTAEELHDVLRVTHGNAERILTRLRDLHVVEGVPQAAASAFTGSWVQRSRLRGVALPLVWRFLERRNVLHL